MRLSNSGQLLLAVIVWVFSLQGFWRRCLVQGCWEEERNALLQLKAYFNYPNGTSPFSWGGNQTNCCEWGRVGCYRNTIGRVDSLDLSRVRANDIETREEWFLNASLFIPFKELNYLDLDGNSISGCVENGGFEKLSQLSKLEGLSLSDNKLNNSILLSLGSISSLRFLHLDGNRLSGTINMKELNNLTNLVYLYLGRNKIEDFKSLQGDQEVLNLNKLESLELGFNILNSSVLSFINNLPSIKYLDIFDNQLQGSFDMKELYSLINLVELDLSGNKIRTFVGSRGFNELRRLVLQNVSTNSSSIVLQSLGAFPFLETLDLRGNNFEGQQIFHQDSQSLMKLEELCLDFSTLDEKSLENFGATLPSLKDFSLRYLRKPLSFQGHLTFKHLEKLDMTGSTVNISFLQTVGTMTTLEKLDLSESNLNGTLPATQGLCNLKNLRELDLSRAGLTGTLPVCLFNLTHLESLQMGYNNLSGALSASLANLTSLQLLDLSYNHLLRGEFPTWLLENNRELRSIHLDGCSFSGPLRLPNQPHLNLSGFDISHNRFHGHIPEEVGIIFPNLRDFAMSNNTFHGRLPSSLGNMTSLVSLDLSGNSLSGEIPGSLAFDCFSLSYLILSNNNLDGQIFSSGVNYQRLGFLFLDGNQFTGTIPDSLSNLSSTLAYMDLSRNRITGHMPVWMGNMSSLGFLDLSHNGISGSLPYRFSPCALQVVSLSSNKLEGSLASTFYGCSKLVALDLGHNYFTGTIPRGIGSLSQLSYVILRANNLEGDIPLQLCKLKKLTFIDLSHNNLSGHVLPCLRCTSNEGYTSLLKLELLTKKVFYLYNGQILRNMSGIDVSFNNLTGRIPPEIGNLTDLKVLNLSFNGFTGQIPTTFSNLKQVESLDLSHNKLAGNIPPELSELNFLAVFSVAYNNLTGKIPDSRQFATFENSSYEGNPFLCGPPLTKPCSSPESPSSFPKTPTDSDEESGFMDIVAFKVSFLVAYFMVMLAIASVLYINPQWRRAWFYFIGVIINKCYYFLVDNLPVPSRFRYWQPCN